MFRLILIEVEVLNGQAYDTSKARDTAEEPVQSLKPGQKELNHRLFYDRIRGRRMEDVITLQRRELSVQPD